jgi:hypothetical protein
MKINLSRYCCLLLRLSSSRTIKDWESADPLATPLEILFEWYFNLYSKYFVQYPIVSFRSLPAGLLTIPFLENVNRFPLMQNILWLSLYDGKSTNKELHRPKLRKTHKRNKNLKVYAMATQRILTKVFIFNIDEPHYHCCFAGQAGMISTG